MSSTEPRVTSSADAGDRPATGSGNGTNGTNGAATVTVAAGVENALAAVQQRLAREAAEVQLLPPPAAVAVAPARPAEPVPVREVAPVRPSPVPAAPAPPDTDHVAAVVVASSARLAEPDTDDRYDDDAAFWGETRRTPTERRIDPETLTRDERKALGRLRARKVRRIVRHVSPWSVFKFSIFFYLCLWLILLVAGVILWKVGQTAGVITNFEKFYAKASGEKVFEIDGRRVFTASAEAGAILVLAATGFTVMLCVLFNVITDLTGGIRLSVIELESARRDLRRRPAADDVLAMAQLDLTDGDADPATVPADLDIDRATTTDRDVVRLGTGSSPAVAERTG